MKTRVASFIISLFLCQSLHSQEYKLTGDLRVHDPVMIKQGSVYYIFATGKGISSKISTDMLNWKRMPPVFDTLAMPAWHKTDIPEQDKSIWAPDISYRDGKYYLYYSVSAWMNFNSSIGLATNTTLDPADPAYKWKDEGKIVDFRNGGEGVNVIDPNLVVEKNGRVWLAYGSYKAGLRLLELDKKSGRLKDEKATPVVLTKSLGEGVFIIRGKDGFYYIFASRGICCKGMESTYQVVMGRSRTITGPYLNKSGESWVENKYTLFLEGDQDEPGRGHNAFYTKGDTTFNVYHAYTRSQDGKSMLNIKPVYEAADGWPTMAKTGKLFRRDK